MAFETININYSTDLGINYIPCCSVVFNALQRITAMCSADKLPLNEYKPLKQVNDER